jgi:dephospho-CoA kinase
MLSHINKMKVIALCGYKQSGKDTIARHLETKNGFVHAKISHALKDMCVHLFGLSEEQIEGDKKEDVDQRWGVTPRRLMQFVGTEMMQYKIQELLPNVKRDFWIAKMCKDMPRNHNIVISDMRFLHECEYLRREFGEDLIVIKINKQCDQTDVHCSEEEWKSIKADVTFNNNADKDLLFAACDEFMQNL